MKINLTKEKGAAALELALVLPVLVMILVGIIQFGIILNALETVTFAAREGARAGALSGAPTKVVAVATSAASSLGNVAITHNGQFNRGQILSVKVTYQLPFNLMPGLIKDNVVGRAAMMVEKK